MLLLGVGTLFVAFHILVNGWAWIKSSFTKVDHPTSYRFVTYDKLLHQVVKGDAVDYATLKKLPELDKAVDELAVVAPDKLNSDKEKLCYWLNAYNLLMLKSLSDKYPIASPRKLGNSISFRKFTVGGDTYSVRDIIDYKLSPFFKRNPLLTFLVCGGAKGEPPLLDHALEPVSVIVDAQTGLDNFVNNPANTRYDEVAGVFYVSPYFQRYDDYFVAYFESPHMLAASHMKKSVPAAQVSLLKKFTRDFDWRLNDVETASVQPKENKDSVENKARDDNKISDDKPKSSADQSSSKKSNE